MEEKKETMFGIPRKLFFFILGMAVAWLIKTLAVSFIAFYKRSSPTVKCIVLICGILSFMMMVKTGQKVQSIEHAQSTQYWYHDEIGSEERRIDSMHHYAKTEQDLAPEERTINSKKEEYSMLSFIPLMIIIVLWVWSVITKEKEMRINRKGNLILK